MIILNVYIVCLVKKKYFASQSIIFILKFPDRLIFELQVLYAVLSKAPECRQYTSVEPLYSSLYTLRNCTQSCVRFLHNMYHIVVGEIKGYLIKLSLLNVKYIAWYVNNKLPDSHSVHYTNCSIFLVLKWG